MQTLLLTGASGFLGKHIFQQLQSIYKIDTLGRANTADYVVDLSAEIPSIGVRYDLVIHAAAKAHSFPTSEKDAADFFNVNEIGTQHLCEAFDRSWLYPEQVVFISTVAVYGLEIGEAIDEETALNGKSPYAKSKINAELFLTEWCKRHSVILTILRLPLIASANPPGNLGALISAIKQGRYFNIGKGDARKSLVRAEDVAACMPVVAAIGGTYNLSDGYHPTFAELAAVIAKQCGKRSPKNIAYGLALLMAYAGTLLGGKSPFNMHKLHKITASLTFDDRKARKAFGWNPKPVLDHFTIN